MVDQARPLLQAIGAGAGPEPEERRGGGRVRVAGVEIGRDVFSV
jgi:hypothetical protein